MLRGSILLRRRGSRRREGAAQGAARRTDAGVEAGDTGRARGRSCFRRRGSIVGGSRSRGGGRRVRVHGLNLSRGSRGRHGGAGWQQAMSGPVEGQFLLDDALGDLQKTLQLCTVGHGDLLGSVGCGATGSGVATNTTRGRGVVRKLGTQSQQAGRGGERVRRRADRRGD